MKKLFIISVAFASLITSQDIAAQAPRAYKLTIDDSSSPALYAQPTTTVKVKVIVEKESIRTGPYARYAQKYLGAIAPLNDKDIYSIKSADIDYIDPDRTTETSCCCSHTAGTKVLSHVYNETEFVKALPDRMTSIEKSAEEMARETANNIFTLRKRKFDLISGEAGENVYGEGMKAALEEMVRLEHEYLALFLGKQTITTIVKEYDVVPEAGKTNYVVFRFTAESGIVPDSDLSANPIVLVLNPENTLGVSSKSDKKLGSYYRIPEWVTCRLMDESQELAAARIPIYQFGATVPGK